MKKYLIVLILIIILVPYQIQAKQLSAQGVLQQVVRQLDQVKDFKGKIISKVYSSNQITTHQVQVMKSKTRSLTQNLGNNKIEVKNQTRLLNSLPWIYLPPNYAVIKNTLPLEGQLDYQAPLKKLNRLYEIKLLGEAIYNNREVYIVQLENLFSSQRLFIDKKWNSISKIEVFNGSNIKVADIRYRDFKSFTTSLWLPTTIEVYDNQNQKVLEISYQNLQVNSGLTSFDFAQGFQLSYQQQIEKLRTKLNNRPQDDNLYWLISQLYQKNGNIKKAVINLQQAIKLNDNIKYRKELAQLYRNQGKYRQALIEVKSALQLDYNNASLHYLLGEIRLELGRLNQARYSLEKAIDFSPQNITYLEKLFWVYYNLIDEKGNYMLERSERIIKKLVELEPNNKNYKIYLGDIYLKKGKKLKAASAYNKAIQLAPQDTWGYVKLAEFYEIIGRYNKAEELYRYILYLDDSLRNHRRLAKFYFDHQKYKLALKEYKIIDQRGMTNLDTKLKLAEIYLAVGEQEKGLDMFKNILQTENDSSLYLETGEIVRKYDLNAAISIYRYSLTKKEQLTSKQLDKIYYRLGNIYWEQQNQQKLEQLFQFGLQGNMYQLLGKYEFKAGDLDQAISYFKLAVNQSNNIEYHYDLAVSYLMVESFNLAKQEGNKLIWLGASEEGKDLIEIANKLINLRAKYSDKYVPGRISCLQGDKLRQQGRLNQALIKYKAAIYENYEYKLPYFYTALIYASQNKDLELKLALNSLQGYNYELKLLNRLISKLKRIRQFTGLDL